MGGNQDDGGAGLEADPALDTERGLADVDVVADPIGFGRAAHGGNQVGGGEFLAVETDRNPQLPAHHDVTRCGGIGGRIEQLGGRRRPGVVGPAAAPGGAPEALVDTERARLRRDRKLPGLEVGNRGIAGEAFVANRRHDREFGSQHPERDVEADLVVAGAGRSMRHRAGPNPAGDVDHRNGLLGPLGGHAQRVDFAPEHVPLDQIADEPFEDGLAGIDFVVLDRADGHGLAADLGEFFGAGAAGVDVDGVDDESLFREPGHAIAGVEAARKGEGESLFMHNA